MGMGDEDYAAWECRQGAAKLWMEEEMVEHIKEPWEEINPLPWRVFNFEETIDPIYDIIDANNNIIVLFRSMSKSAADAIVARFNDCVGIPTEALEEGVLTDLIRILTSIEHFWVLMAEQTDRPDERVWANKLQSLLAKLIGEQNDKPNQK